MVQRIQIEVPPSVEVCVVRVNKGMMTMTMTTDDYLAKPDESRWNHEDVGNEEVGLLGTVID